MSDQRLKAAALLRWTRACLLAATVLTISALAHTSAGGLLPSTLTLVGLAAVTTLVLAALLGRPASRTRVVVLLAGGQAVLHAVMTALSGHAQRQATEHVHHAHASAQSAHVQAPLDAVGTWLSHLQDDLSGPNLAMAGAHLLAAAALGWWLATGEEALWALILMRATPALVLLTRRLAMAVRTLTGGVDSTDFARLASPRPEPIRPEDQLLLACAVVRRGPPRRLSA